MKSDFVHLNVHTEYSIVDGIVRVDDLVETVKQAGMWGVAVTDRMNLFAAVKFFKAALSAKVKPIIGCEILLKNTEKQPVSLLLLSQNKIGYRHLTQLVSKAYTEGQDKGVPFVDPSWLTRETTEGLIALSGGMHGLFHGAFSRQNEQEAAELLDKWALLFPDRFYVEVQRIGKENSIHDVQAISLANQKGLPLVATNPVRFLKQDEFDAHEARVCIHNGNVLSDEKRPHDYTPQQYLRSPAEMTQLFSDLPEALENSVEIAKRCSFELPLGQTFLPNYPLPPETTAADVLKQQAQAGLEKNLALLFDTTAPEFAEQRKVYDARLQSELDVINPMGFASYFLIVADFIRWSWEHDIPVGPGRGSGAGSLVAYSLGITDLDPLKYDLLFERFLNPERVSMPDFDVDFCMDGRDRVIEYVTEKYGRENVAQIITYGTMAAKAVIRDVGRVLGHPYGFVDKIAKMVPFELGITLDKALEEEEFKQRYESDEEVRDLVDLARQLEGITRNAGKHAGGVVIAPTPLTDFVALYCEAEDSNYVTQFDKDDVESVGLVKFDFLGLRTLTIIHSALKSINEKLPAAEAIDIRLIPLDDEKTYQLLKRCATTAVFQLESRGMKDLIKRLQPDCFEDIVALVALFRPGPLQSGMVDDFIDRKHGRAKVEYLHESLATVLKPTYGVILYQEQVMQIAQVLSGYTLGGADLLRRAMGKKKAEEMAKQRAFFVAGALERHTSAETATQIFDLIEKFAGYGFNKSHSAAYALLAYQTAWLKAHYPADFMAAVLSSDMDNTDKVVGLIDECRQMNLTVLPPDIHKSQYKFVTESDSSVRYGLGALKGVGLAAIDLILGSREQDGDFKDLFDLCARLDLRKVNRRVLEALIRGGALDSFGLERSTLFANLDRVIQAAEQQARASASRQIDLFADIPDSQPLVEYQTMAPWSDDVRLEGEKEILGLYLTGHPIQKYQRDLSAMKVTRIADLRPQRDQSVVVAGYVTALRTWATKRGDKMAFVTLDDGSARIELAIFAGVYETTREIIVKDQLCIVEGEVSSDDYSGGYRLGARQVFDIESARVHFGKHLLLKTQAQHLTPQSIKKIHALLERYRGEGMRVVFEYQCDAILAAIPLTNWRVQPQDALIDALQALLEPLKGEVSLVF